MAVRVNKSAFNIREKLSELAVKFGLKGSELMRAETVQDARDLVSAGRKNLIINGDMKVHQRGGSLELDAAEHGYSLDRWASSLVSTGVISTSQQSSSPPPGFTNYIETNVDTANTPATSEYGGVYQAIEGLNMQHLKWGTSEAKYATLSFWHKHSISGAYCISVRNGSSNYNYIIEYQQKTADVWEKQTFVIKPPTSGTFSVSNTSALTISFYHTNKVSYQTTNTESWFSGTYYHSTPNQVQMMATENAKFRLGGVQLEVGKNATEFEHRSYGEELALCQRYYEQYAYTNQYEWISTCRLNSSGSGECDFTWYPKRIEPTITTNGAGNFRVNDNTNDTVCTGVVPNTNLRPNGGQITFNSAGAFTQNAIGYINTQLNNDAYIYIDAEL